MQYAIDTSNQLSKNQPPPKWDMNVGYHGADILRFVDNERLLVGSVTFDVAGLPEYGPLMILTREALYGKKVLRRRAFIHTATHLRLIWQICL